MPDTSEGLADVLTVAVTRRLGNQIARTYRGTYGAETGLGMIVRSAARQMLRAGSSPDAVSRAFEEQVLSHHARVAGDVRSAASEAHVKMLIELTRQCVVDVALEQPRET